MRELRGAPGVVQLLGAFEDHHHSYIVSVVFVPSRGFSRSSAGSRARARARAAAAAAS